MNKNSLNKISTDQQSEDSIDCSCQILNDTSLSDVGDSDCSCSQCLEANLNAFNELKQLQQQQKLLLSRSLGKIKTKMSKDYDNQKDQQKTINRFDRNSYSSVSKRTKLQNPGKIGQNQGQSYRFNRFTRQNINDYILITRQRTRQYLNQRNKVQNQNKKLKDQLKSKIKQNLQILKYSVKSIRQKNINQDKQSSQITHNYKWNHAPAVSKEIQEIRETQNQSKSKLKYRQQQRKKIDTNLQKLVPQFLSNPSQFLQDVKQKRLQKFKQCKGCPYDHCPNHHMRTSKQKLQQIEQFILRKTKQYTEKRKNEKKLNEQKQKIKKAKLRAIQIKSKDALKRSKKYDPSESRTSFHLTIDHFSTFSDLKANKKQKDQEKQHRKEVKKMMKQKGGKWEQAIYEDQFQNQPPIQSNVKQQFKKSQPVLENKKQFYEKITKQAKIYSPKKVKPQDQKHFKEKKQKKKKTMNSNQEKNKAKQVALEIQRKKRELMEEYKKQSLLKQSKNEKIKDKFSQSLQRVKS